MIKASVCKESGLLTLTIDGHAGFARIGEDIVCAAASVLSQSVLFALEGVEGIQLESDIQPGYLWLMCSDTPVTRTMMAVAEAGLEQLAKQYPNHVQYAG